MMFWSELALLSGDHEDRFQVGAALGLKTKLLARFQFKTFADQLQAF
jgi:hypothetical protein